MNVFFIGDIMGEPGRRVLLKHLSKVVQTYQVDLVIGNGENAAGGFGITPDIAEELFDFGLSAITLGNHAWDKKEALDYIDKEARVIRPANYPDGVPGKGVCVIETAQGDRLAIVQLMGRVFMPMLDCPFQVAERELARLEGQTRSILIDMHAEASSEKMAMGYFLDGKVSAVVGTHTHVQTADEQILPKGTGYMTDLGMTGPLHSVIGMKPQGVIQKFLTQVPRRFEVAQGPSLLCGAVIGIDAATGKTNTMHRVRIHE
ncbi:MAG: TIGR00282 family metallophosphoesterase [Nitrospira sp.]|nr:TIGR00282 family metallophosphoesterase [Nitrospira sp.]MCA9476192.1 TIGR00282 family metallophosphoesterase [Nitrospira sp.]MCA9481025.1 TIGR00282 family metallophosphoesterase [Nitrospira sp.]MCB9710067.1 TIGR00282 family metallophosphoesterase [Nitrospiraceae bacterium]MDR4488123.1 TIGR00282 family metallophosphoesterase [Nitrospirales bacterium]